MSDPILTSKQYSELNFLMGQVITEAVLGNEKLKETIYLENGVYIDVNLKWRGFSFQNVTYSNGYKTQELREDIKKIRGDAWGDNFPANCCRICGEVIKPYKNIYFKRFNEYTNYWFKAYGFKNNYCEPCAQKQAETEKPGPKCPKLIKDYKQHLAGDKYETRVMEFEGFTIQSNDAWKSKK